MRVLITLALFAASLAAASPGLPLRVTPVAAFEDEVKLDFADFAENHIEEHGLVEKGLTFEAYLDSEHFLRIPMAAFDVRYPVDAAGDGPSVDLLKETLEGLLATQEAWFSWRSNEPTSKEVQAHWKALNKWVSKWSARKLSKCTGGDDTFAVQMGADEKILAALAELREMTRPAADTIANVGDLNLTVIAPTRQHFLEFAAIGGYLDPTQQGSLWSDKLLNQTAAWYNWVQILALTNADYPPDPKHPFIDTPKKAGDKSALLQYVADRASVAMLRKDFWRHGTAFFEEALGTNLVITVAGKNGQFTTGEWSMSWSRAGASTQPYSRFVPGGNPGGGVLPARKAIPGPMQMSMSVNGVEISKYRAHLGEDYFLSVLSDGQESGYKIASKTKDARRRRDKNAHFELVSGESHETSFVTAPFLGQPAEGKELPPDDFLDVYEDFFRAYRSCFLNWMRNHAGGSPVDSQTLFGTLIVNHAGRDRGALLDPIVLALYKVPLSSMDESTDSLENRFLEWLRKNG